MSYIIHIFCRVDTFITLGVIAEAVTEGQFLDQDPSFDPDPRSSEASSWHTLRVRWSPNKDPIVFGNHRRDEALRDSIARLMFILDVSRKTKPRQRVVDHLDQTAQMITIEVNRGQMTEDTWAMLDAVEAQLAKAYQGIVFTQDEGFFDENLKHFYKL